jgi:eukaryotic-like serine/threonine-protein kinase
MMLSRYEQIQPLGIKSNSNMNELYKAYDRQAQQDVIIKARSRKASGDPERCKMFEREIAIAQKLKHPCILHLIEHNYGVLPHQRQPVPFMVYPYMPHGSLSDFLKDQPSWWKTWPPLQIAHVLLQAASALMYMHQQSPPIVHQDVKPDNFLIQRKYESPCIERVFLCDFGIARTLNPLCEGGKPQGTSSHMAPEQFEGKVTCQSDQYVLAFIASYLFTGQYPLEPSGKRTWNAWKEAHTYRRPKFPPHFSADISAVLLQALRKKPEERFSTIWDFAFQAYLAIKKQTGTSISEDLLVELTPAKTLPQGEPEPLHPIMLNNECSLAQVSHS